MTSSITLAMNSEAIRPQTSVGLLREQRRPGRDVVERERADHHRRGARARHAERQHRHERARRGRVVRRLGRGHAADVALAEGAFLVGEALLHRVGHRAGDGGAGAGQHADDEADHAGAHRAPPGLAPSPCRLNIVRPVVRDHAGAAVVLLEHQQDLADREHADHHDDELDAVGQVHVVAGEAVDAGVRVEPDASTATGRSPRPAPPSSARRPSGRRCRRRRSTSARSTRPARTTAPSAPAAARTARCRRWRSASRRTSSRPRSTAPRRPGPCAPSGSRRARS